MCRGAMAGWKAVKPGMDQRNLAILVGIHVESLWYSLYSVNASI